MEDININSRISLIAQSAIRIQSNDGQIIYFDPYKLDDKCNADADYIFITHSHFDHFSQEDVLRIKKDNTTIIAPEDLENKIKQLGFNDNDILLVTPNEDYVLGQMVFSTIPAYNLNKDFHKKVFDWVGYIVSIDGEKIYVAGDTDNTEEARKVKCDIACVPIGGTYTMTYEEAAKLVKEINPKIAIPTHYKTIVGSVEDAYRFKELLDGCVDVIVLME